MSFYLLDVTLLASAFIYQAFSFFIICSQKKKENEEPFRFETRTFESPVFKFILLNGKNKKLKLKNENKTFDAI
jgi:hypothetical protein